MATIAYNIRLIGDTPLLLHQDNLPWAELVDKWQKDPENRKGSVAGDDRYPAWRWIGCLYHDAGRLVLAADNLMAALRDGGAKCPTGKGRTTYKAITQSALMVEGLGWPLLVDGSEVPWAPIWSLREERDFTKHQALVESLGFGLSLKRASVGQTKHVRVRPKFERWECSGTISVLDPVAIPEPVLVNILTQAGRYAGIGDWRPGAKQAPGQFGRFHAEVERVR